MTKRFTDQEKKDRAAERDAAQSRRIAEHIAKIVAEAPPLPRR
jgi:hypothetical protein